MTEPTFDSTTERTYERLPQAYRTEDIGQDWQLKKYMSGDCGQLNDIDTLIERFTYDSPEDGVADPHETSDLVDPATADAEWLPWLAQIVGVKLNTTATEIEQREQILNRTFYRGTKADMAHAAQMALIGDKYIAIYDHTSDSSAIGAAGQWDVLVVTKATETVGDVAATIIAAGAKPAGVVIHTETFTSTWDDVEAAYGTWNTWDATSWNQLEESGL